jgi:hypothetical protein
MAALITGFAPALTVAGPDVEPDDEEVVPLPAPLDPVPDVELLLLLVLLDCCIARAW